MIRLRTYFKSSEEYQETLNQLGWSGLKHWTGKGYGKFIDNYKLDSLWLGIDTIKNKNSKNGNIFCMEFNPNKLTDNDIIWINLFLHHFKWDITRVDLAIDIPRNINQIIFTNLRKKSYSLFYVDFNNKTYYFGKGDGHTKIYNKKVESSLPYELTRYEVTKSLNFPLDSFERSFIDFGFLDIAFTPYVSSSSEDDTLNAVLYAVNNGYPYRSLSRRYKDIIKKDFLGCYELSNDEANAALTDFLQKLKVGLSNKPT